MYGILTATLIHVIPVFGNDILFLLAEYFSIGKNLAAHKHHSLGKFHCRSIKDIIPVWQGWLVSMRFVNVRRICSPGSLPSGFRFFVVAGRKHDGNAEYSGSNFGGRCLHNM